MTTTLDEPRFPVEAPKPRGGPWYTRRGAIATASIIAIVVVAVLTDLPAPASRSSDLAAAKTVVNQVNQDLRSCAFSVREAYTIYVAASRGTLTAAQRARAPKLLTEDQMACSFYSENSTMFDLSTIDVPSAAADRPLAQLIDTTTIWATGDALGSIEAIQTLLTDPGNAAAHRALARYEGLLESDRLAALGAVSQVQGNLGAGLPVLAIPPVSTTGQGLLTP